MYLSISLKENDGGFSVNPITKEKLYYRQFAILPDYSVSMRMENKAVEIAVEIIERKKQEQKNEIERKKKVFKPYKFLINLTKIKP